MKMKKTIQNKEPRKKQREKNGRLNAKSKYVEIREVKVGSDELHVFT